VERLRASDVERYLGRIGSPAIGAPDRTTLELLQGLHLLHVPFENLDIHRDVAIELDHAAIAAKVIDRRRGGYCYELNSLFGRLLAELGYDVEMISARVVREGGGESQEFAHLALLVRVDGEPAPFLTDVGFGDAFATPMPLLDGFERVERDKRVRLVRRGDRWAYQDHRGEGWSSGYTFSTRARRFDDFAEMNVWQQTAPESHFRTQPMSTMLTATGRVTLAGRRLIVTDRSQRMETELSEADVPTVLRERFGVVLD
jgi:N-hydroxyarylamine O-acetyltransferase